MADITDFDIPTRDAVYVPDDAKYDPELEAHLYSQIYHSNETFPDKNNASQLSENTPNQQLHWSIDPNPSQQIRKSTLYTTSRSTIGIPPLMSQPISPPPPPSMSHQVTPSASKRHRPLLDGINKSPKYRGQKPTKERRGITDQRNTPQSTSTRSAINMEKNPTTPEQQLSSTEKVKKTSQDQQQRDKSKLTSPKKTKESDDTSTKYSVATKQKPDELSKIYDEPESSDSDDSIQEVPVPPKPTPLLIDLPDSDESSDDERDPVVKMNKIIYTDANTSTIEDNVEIPSTAQSEVENIVINCTEVQRGAASLEEIRRTRDNVDTNDNDESMTESEAVNSVVIERQRTNEITTETSTTIIQETSSLTQSVENTSVLINDTDTRKRSRTGTNCDDKNDPKRQKSMQKATVDMTYEEYIFQPMNKNIQAFYNEPRRDAIPNVRQLQSQMPSNPKNWPILSADLQVSRSKNRGKTCAVCQREGHTRGKCPERQAESSCHMCGEVGHLEPRCPLSMCLTCGTKYSSYRKTCEVCEKLQCSTCKGYGHESNKCPDLWRRYHQTKRVQQLKTPIKEEINETANIEEFKIPVHTSTSVNNDEIPKITPKIEENGEKKSSTINRTNSTIFNGEIIFHFKTKITTTPLLCSTRLKPDDIAGANLRGLIAGTVFPLFIIELEEIAPFELLIGYHHDVLQIFLQGQSKDVLDHLEKLMIMWLLRCDDEKGLMVGTKTLPYTRNDLMRILHERSILSRTIWTLDDQEKMEDHMKHMRRLTRTIRETHDKFSYPRPPQVEKTLANVEKSLVDLKWKVVLCLYHCMWVTKAKETISEFKILMDRLKQLQCDKVPVITYLKIVIHCNEVFIGHLSVHIVEAAQKCIKCMRRRKSNERRAEYYATPDPTDDESIKERDKIKEILDKLMYQYNNCRRAPAISLDLKQCRKRYYTVENLLSQLHDNQALLRCLQKYKVYIDKRETFPKTGFLGSLNHICGVLRTKLKSPNDWKRKRLEEINCKVEFTQPGPSKSSKVPEKITKVPVVVKPKIEKLSRTVKEVVPSNRIMIKSEPGTMSIKSENENQEDKMVLSNLDALEELLNDPVLGDDY